MMIEGARRWSGVRSYTPFIMMIEGARRRSGVRSYTPFIMMVHEGGVGVGVIPLSS